MENTLIALLFLWIGFVAAISFMESWLKFQVKELTLKVGLSIGKKVFGALNKVEIVITIGILLIFFFNTLFFSLYAQILLFLAVFLLFLQTVWLLPTLNQRVQLLLSDKKPGKSWFHTVYVGTEVGKMACLILLGIHLIH